jgi:hypothetical protein
MYIYIWIYIYGYIYPYIERETAEINFNDVFFNFTQLLSF